jgi:hypothetical protein
MHVSQVVAQARGGRGYARRQPLEAIQLALSGSAAVRQGWQCVAGSRRTPWRTGYDRKPPPVGLGRMMRTPVPPFHVDVVREILLQTEPIACHESQ